MAGMSEGGRNSEPIGAYFAQPQLNEAITSLALRQHSVFALDQLGDVGVSGRAVQKRVAVGRLYRIRTNVYSLVPRKLLTREGHWMAAVLACGPGAVLSHRTAAALHGLRPTDRAKIDVTVPGRSRTVRSGTDMHRSLTLAPADISRENGIPCTSIARTLLDLAGVIGRRPLERAFDQAEAMQVFDLRAIEDQLARNSTRRAAKLVRSLLDEHYVGSTLTRSELEEAFLALCRRLGLPHPKVNRWVDLGDGEPMLWADFV